MPIATLNPTLTTQDLQRGHIDADPFLENDEDFDYVSHARRSLAPLGYVLLAQCDDTLDEIHYEPLRSLGNASDVLSLLREQDDVKTFHYRTWNTRNNAYEYATVYYCSQDKVEELEKALKPSYTLRCTWMGDSADRTELDREDLESSDRFQFAGEDLEKPDGDTMTDAYGGYSSEPLDWRGGSATETGMFTCLRAETQEQLDYLNTLCARAGLVPMTLVKDEDGDSDWFATYSRDGANAAQIAALDTAEWEVIEE